MFKAKVKLIQDVFINGAKPYFQIKINNETWSIRLSKTKSLENLEFEVDAQFLIPYVKPIDKTNVLYHGPNIIGSIEWI